MHRSIKQKITAWTAIAAVLMMVLAPCVSRALSMSPDRATDAFWMDICSAVSGNIAAASAVSDFFSETSPDSSKSRAVPAHCPYCLMHADLIAPPLTAASAKSVFSISYLLPPLFYRSAQTLFAWTVASSRAPPATA